MDAKNYFFPETAAGGFSRVDGTVEFFTRVNSLLERSMNVLDFGAGRGASLHDDPCDYRRELQRLKGKVANVVGVDVDNAVLQHPGLDEVKIIKPGEPLPYQDNTFDLIISDYVFEHIDNPDSMAQEFERVIKPRGWVCARTPHLWGYIGLGARLTPNIFHAPLVKKLQPGDREEYDVFPTRYQLNTRQAIRRYFPSSQWDHFCYSYNAEPAYFGNSKIMWWIMMRWFDFTPSALDTVLMIFLRKKEK